MFVNSINKVPEAVEASNPEWENGNKLVSKCANRIRAPDVPRRKQGVSSELLRSGGRDAADQGLQGGPLESAKRTLRPEVWRYLP